MTVSADGTRRRFVDLFAGLGGFHLALRRLGWQCVLASEIDPVLRAFYRDNFGLSPAGDIRALTGSGIPEHDLLCAGFPCQPFSKAGEQAGLDDPHDGDLFHEVVRVLRARRPRYLLLENVPNLLRHRDGATWRGMETALHALGYDVRHAVRSPHQFGIPQIRQRLFVAGALGEGSLASFAFPEPDPATPEPALASVLDDDPTDAKPVSPRVEDCLEVWQAFLERFPADEKLPSFPIWTMEFGASYPYTNAAPLTLPRDALRHARGSHGLALAEAPDERLADLLPAYARGSEPFPRWKVDFIRWNRELYAHHRDWIDGWLPRLFAFPPSWQKLEWNCGNAERDLRRHVIQFRASGVRVKRATTAPSLVAMTTTQVPIVWQRGRFRYMTARECARLQGMHELPALPAAESRVHAALGNAVNVDLVERIARALLAT